MKIDRSSIGDGIVILHKPVAARRMTGVFLLFVSSVAAAGAVHNFTPGQGHVVYGITSSLIALPALIGGVYMLLLRTGVTIDVTGRRLTVWRHALFWRDEVAHDLGQCTAIEVKRYAYFQRTRAASAKPMCELRLWTAEGDGLDIVLTNRIGEDRATSIATELSNVLRLPIERTKGYARGVVTDD